MTHVEILTVADCPNASLVDGRLAAALSGRGDVRVDRRVVRDRAEAENTGMRGSPTVLVDGRDPFAEPGTPASLSCRLYRTADGRVEGSPSVAALREALG